MVEKLVNKALKRSNAAPLLPKFVTAEKLLQEIGEHFGFLKWFAKRFLVPLAVFYFLTGVLLGEHVLGALLTALLVFLYSAFLPDLDSFFPATSGKKANWREKRLALFFAPVFIYYLLSRKIVPFSLGSEKPFHTKRALLEFSLFLFLSGLLIYFSLLKAFFFAVFGFVGYLTHLIVDKKALP